MANEQLTIQPNDARMTVIGKSWPDQASDSGGGEWDDTYNGTYSGPIPRTDLPVKIAVTTPPTKTEYNKSERIEFDGMVVTAYNEDDTVWTSAKYPDGTIPLNEIISTTKTAGVGKTQYDNVFIGSGVDPEYGTNFKYFLCNHFHLEGVTDRVGSIVTYDFTANDNAVIIVGCKPPEVKDYGVIRYFSINIVAKRASSTAELCKPGVHCASGFYKYDSHWWDVPSEYRQYDFVADSTSFSLGKNNRTLYSRIMDSRIGSGVGSLFSSIFEGEYSCNLPLQYVEWKGSISISGSGTYARTAYDWLYLYVDNFDKLSEVTLYWSRPEDGKYLSCSLPITIKSQEQPGNGGR